MITKITVKYQDSYTMEIDKGPPCNIVGAFDFGIQDLKDTSTMLEQLSKLLQHLGEMFSCDIGMIIDLHCGPDAYTIAYPTTKKRVYCVYDMLWIYEEDLNRH